MLKINYPKLLLSVFFLSFSVNSIAEKCYIDARPAYKETPGERETTGIYLDILPVEVEAVKFSTNDYLSIVKNDRTRLEEAVNSFVREKIDQVEKNFSKHAGRQIFAGVSAKCYLTASSAESQRKKGENTYEMELHGNWAKSLGGVDISSSGDSKKKEQAAASERPINGAILKRSTDPSKQTPEQLEAQKNREAANQKSKEAAAAAEERKQVKQVAAAKARDDKQRSICMKPEHRGDCGCLKYFSPDPTRTACSK